MPQTTLSVAKTSRRTLLRSHLAIMRFDHAVKQLFIYPGTIVAIFVGHLAITRGLLWNIVLGTVAITAVASSNYVLNEILDAPFDRLHPTKHTRPAASGLVNLPLAYAQWIALAAIGFLLAASVAKGVLIAAVALWIMGCAYNVSPVRLKDIAYVDVLSEAINNPIRFLAGWYLATAVIAPPAMLLVAYWMLGGYFMALKRFSEYRQIGPENAGFYRRSFRHYTEKKLLNSTVFYASSAMLFFGAFIMHHCLQLFIAFPFISLLMTEYFSLSFDQDSAVQNPEKLWKQPRLMFLTVASATLLTLLLFMHLPSLSPSWF